MIFSIYSERFLLVGGKHHIEIVCINIRIISVLITKVEMILTIKLYLR
jgi:hypothetical protein